MKKFFAIISAILTIGFMISDLFGHEVKVSHLWTTASGDSPTAMVYMRIDNDTTDPDSLTTVQSEAADKAVIKQETQNDDGTTKTEEVKSIDIPGGDNKVLKPKGTYIVLSGLKKPLVAGDKIPITFVFDKRGLMEQHVVVEDAAATDYVEQ